MKGLLILDLLALLSGIVLAKQRGFAPVWFVISSFAWLTLCAWSELALAFDLGTLAVWGPQLPYLLALLLLALRWRKPYKWIAFLYALPVALVLGAPLH